MRAQQEELAQDSSCTSSAIVLNNLPDHRERILCDRIECRYGL